MRDGRNERDWRWICLRERLIVLAEVELYLDLFLTFGKVGNTFLKPGNRFLRDLLPVGYPLEHFGHFPKDCPLGFHILGNKTLLGLADGNSRIQLSLGLLAISRNTLLQLGSQKDRAASRRNTRNNQRLEDPTPRVLCLGGLAMPSFFSSRCTGLLPDQ